MHAAEEAKSTTAAKAGQCKSKGHNLGSRLGLDKEYRRSNHKQSGAETELSCGARPRFDSKLRWGRGARQGKSERGRERERDHI